MLGAFQSHQIDFKTFFSFLSRWPNDLDSNWVQFPRSRAGARQQHRVALLRKLHKGAHWLRERQMGLATSGTPLRDSTELIAIRRDFLAKLCHSLFKGHPTSWFCLIAQLSPLLPTPTFIRHKCDWLCAAGCIPSHLADMVIASRVCVYKTKCMLFAFCKWRQLSVSTKPVQ